jgi:hypothetical protein
MVKLYRLFEPWREDGCGCSTAVAIRRMPSDYLGSTNVVTNASGTPIQTLEYMFWGAFVRLEIDEDCGAIF